MILDLFKTPTLDALARRFGTDKSSKAHNFAGFYDAHFSSLRSSPVRLLEVGVGRGASLRMWRRYFRRGTIFAVDSEARKNIYRFYGSKIYIGSQRDTAFLDRVMGEIGPMDIIIDDGSHCVSDQQITLGALFPYLKPGGYYVIEDIHTSFLNPNEDFGLLPDGSNSTYGMLEEFQQTRKLKSQYLSDSQIKYLSENIRTCELFFFEEKQKHATSLIRKV